jgi:hypothetical protein
MATVHTAKTRIICRFLATQPISELDQSDRPLGICQRADDKIRGDGACFDQLLSDDHAVAPLLFSLPLGKIRVTEEFVHCSPATWAANTGDAQTGCDGHRTLWTRDGVAW